MTDADKKLYDKAVEALDQMGAGLPSEIEKYVPAWIDGYKEGLKVKINATTISDCPIKDEYHRLGKNPNDLPDEDVPVLCVRGSNIYVAWYSNNEWRGTRWEQVKKPYAWKEIELPKEEE